MAQAVLLAVAVSYACAGVLVGVFVLHLARMDKSEPMEEKIKLVVQMTLLWPVAIAAIMDMFLTRRKRRKEENRGIHEA